MPTKPNTPEQLQEAVDLLAEYGDKTSAAAAAGLPTSTYHNRYRKAVSRGFKPRAALETDPQQTIRLLKDRNAALEQQLTRAAREDQLDRWVREELFRIKETAPTPPGWVHAPGAMSHSSPGTPCLALGDWHWAETVDPAQVNGLNEYSIEIGHRRAKRVIDTTVDLLKHHMVKPDYPGIVLFLLGDMISGDIHQELKETNEIPTIPTVLDLVGVLRQSLSYLVDHFARVHVVCVVGNHGRNTVKPQAKNRTATSFDWLLYRLVEQHFEDDDRVTFQIPDGADARVKVYNHDYLVTHGDQFRGGDGVIGPLGPLVRGDYKKRLRESMVDQTYDTLLCGHFHRLITLSQLIVNGSLVGYNEYAYCVTPDTRILTADWQWKPAGDLKKGDELWGFSEEVDPDRKRRLWERSSVVNTGVRVAPTVTVVLESGRTLTSTKPHPWLCRTGPNKQVQWVQAQHIKPGIQLPRYLEPWEQDDSWLSGWLAGMFDGEGSFSWRSQITGGGVVTQRARYGLSISQKEGDTSDNIRAALEELGVEWSEYRKSHNAVVDFIIEGNLRDKLSLLGRIQARRLLDKICPGNALRTVEDEWDGVVAVHDAPDQEIVMLETSSGTYFAEGYGAHNTNNFPFEPPKQALWVTHPRNGITFTLPVLADRAPQSPDEGPPRWVSVPGDPEGRVEG